MANYECTRCGASGCKLWRGYNTFENGPVTLWCLACAEEKANERETTEKVHRIDMPMTTPQAMLTMQAIEEIETNETREEPSYGIQIDRVALRRLCQTARAALMNVSGAIWMKWPIHETAAIRDAFLEGRDDEAIQMVLNELGLGTDSRGHGDQIGGLVPAVPVTASDGTTKGDFWGYTSVPTDAILWWKRLPTAPLRQAKKDHRTPVQKARERHRKNK